MSHLYFWLVCIRRRSRTASRANTKFRLRVRNTSLIGLRIEAKAVYNEKGGWTGRWQQAREPMGSSATVISASVSGLSLLLSDLFGIDISMSCLWTISDCCLEAITYVAQGKPLTKIALYPSTFHKVEQRDLKDSARDGGVELVCNFLRIPRWRRLPLPVLRGVVL